MDVLQVPISFSIFDILIIVGISQGLVTSLLLLTSPQHQLSKKILGVTVLVFCVANCRVLLHSLNLWDVPVFHFFPVGMELFLPPLVYLYVLSLTENEFALKQQYLWHFVPGLLYAIYDISLYLLTIGIDSIPEKDAVASLLYFDTLNWIEDHLIAMMTLVYVGFGYKNISAYLKWLEQFNQYKAFPIYKWLKNIIFWSAILGIILMVNQLMDTLKIAMDEPRYRWRFFNLALAFVTYYLGFMGYKNDGLKIHLSKTNLKSLADKLSSSQIHQLEQQILDKMTQEAVYLDGSLTIKKLAAQLDVTTENLSLVINQKFAMGFRDLINQYRVDHVKQQLDQGTESSMLQVALDSGFNSQASFYRAFKKFEGISPKAYLTQIDNNH